ncbi:hypothetical protein VFPFJ_08634 [Purpureocillium lilacinum]|uniref:Uncharacterized protein n=1 Tax=Purpureocillium lilacinum TaxID=33203 RepID=A0A179H025_PURLI|nr:hypothetical protein VFPFJ_08634 [Purpureocillium lilacinum]OAQ82831.1 hypothetical protein VFPFJ_08634 [Purpureocillium lilacinum]
MKFSSAATIIAALAGSALAMQSEGAKPMDMNMAKENGMPATDSKYDSKSMLGLMMKAGAGEPMEEHEKRQLDALTKLLGVINKRMEMTDMEKRQLGGLGGLLGGLGGLTGQQQPSPPAADDELPGGLPGDDSASGLPGGPAAPVGGAAGGSPVGGAPVGGSPVGGLMKRQGNLDGVGGAGAGGGVFGDDLLGGAGSLGDDSGAGAGGGVIDGSPFGGAGLGHIGGGDDDEDWKAKRNSAPRPMSDMEMVKRQLDIVTGLLGGLLGGGGGGA